MWLPSPDSRLVAAAGVPSAEGMSGSVTHPNCTTLPLGMNPAPRIVASVLASYQEAEDGVISNNSGNFPSASECLSANARSMSARPESAEASLRMPRGSAAGFPSSMQFTLCRTFAEGGDLRTSLTATALLAPAQPYSATFPKTRHSARAGKNVSSSKFIPSSRQQATPCYVTG